MNRFPTLVFATILLVMSSFAANAAEPKRVLILYSFGLDYPPWSETGRRMAEELVRLSPDPVDLYETSIYTARFQPPKDDTLMIGYLRDLTAERKLDLVITLGQAAKDFVQKHRDVLIPDTPWLMTSVSDRSVDRSKLREIDTYLTTKIDIVGFIENILRVRPQTKRVAIIIGNSPVMRFWVQVMKEEYQQFADRLEFIWLNEAPLAEMVAAIEKLPEDSAVQFLMVNLDGAGVPYPQDRAFSLIKQAAKVPLFGYGDYQIGKGIVGGPLSNTRATGERAAEIAVRILGGEPPANTRTPAQDFDVPTYDWRELQRFDISEALLPPHSRILFRPPPVWEHYRWQIIGVLVTIVLLVLMIAWLLLERRRRVEAEGAARERLSELTFMNRRFSAGELSASIAHEINQPLAAIVSNANAATRWLGNKKPDLGEVKSALDRIARDGHRASGVVDTIRSLYRKAPAKHNPVDLNEMVKQVSELVSPELRRNNISLSFQLRSEPVAIDADKTQIQQVIVNLMVNAIEAMSQASGDPRRLKISTAIDANQAFLEVEDNGPGIPSGENGQIFKPFHTSKQKGMGMGLSICKSIVEAHGGTLTAGSASPKGAVFTVTLPLTKAGTA